MKGFLRVSFCFLAVLYVFRLIIDNILEKRNTAKRQREDFIYHTMRLPEGPVKIKPFYVRTDDLMDPYWKSKLRKEVAP